jgi:hypothetical protein
VGWHSFQSSINIIGFYWQSINISWVDTLCPIRSVRLAVLCFVNFPSAAGYNIDEKFGLAIMLLDHVFFFVRWKFIANLDVSKAVKILRGFSMDVGINECKFFSL